MLTKPQLLWQVYSWHRTVGRIWSTYYYYMTRLRFISRIKTWTCRFMLQRLKYAAKQDCNNWLCLQTEQLKAAELYFEHCNSKFTGDILLKDLCSQLLIAIKNRFKIHKKYTETLKNRQKRILCLKLNHLNKSGLVILLQQQFQYYWRYFYKFNTFEFELTTPSNKHTHRIHL